MNDREISLIDMAVEILLGWRQMLAWMLIGGLLFGALSYAKSYKAGQVDLSTKVESEQELLTEKQLNNVNMALDYEAYARERQDYLDSSILMQLDPQNMPQTKLTFLVSGGERAKSVEIVKIYEDLVGGGLLEWLAEQSGGEYTSANYSEVITFDSNIGDLVQGSNSFSLSVVHVTESACRELADWIESYLREQETALQEQLGAHSLEAVNRSFAKVFNATLLTNQRNYRNEVTNFRASAEKLKDAFSEAEKEYYDSLTGAGAETAQGVARAAANGQVESRVRTADEGNRARSNPEEAALAFTPSISPTYVLLGMVLFGFIYVFFAFLKYVLNNRLRACDDLNALYGIPQLALIPARQGRKRLFGAVDRSLRAVRNRGKRVFDREEAVGLAAAAVKLAAKKESVDTVYCIGCDIKNSRETVAERISAALGEENISLKLLNNVLYNRENMEQLLGARAVVLLEQAGETLYGEIAGELELLRRQDIKVLGAVIVE